MYLQVSFNVMFTCITDQFQCHVCHLCITGQFQCHVCQKKLKAEHYLKMHLMIHSGEKPQSYNSFFPQNVCSHIKMSIHWLWMDKIYKPAILLNGHLNLFVVSWMVMWRFNLSFLLNEAPHVVQEKGFSPLWHTYPFLFWKFQLTIFIVTDY
jgi:hypothetical protein